jgi:D-sedoheptulose 7-phosphate isomerase
VRPAVESLGRRLPVLEPCLESLEAAISLIATSLRAQGKVLVCGNGGSASDSEHFVADLMKGFTLRRPIPGSDRARLQGLAGTRGDHVAAHLQGALAAVALVSQTALTTAIANDVRFDMVFAQQVYGLGRRGDVLFAISTSGNSANVVNATVVARSSDIGVVSLTGRDGGELATLADVAICVPADLVFEIQELQMPVYHALALALEHDFFATHAGADGVASADGGPGRVDRRRPGMTSASDSPAD